MAHTPILPAPIRIAKGALIAANALVLAGCSTMKSDPAPGCHGARRQANPYGSVLAPDAEPATAQPLATGPAGCGGRP